MDIRKIHICFVGNMLGRNPGYVTSQGLILADLFAEEGCRITCVSSRINRAARLAEIIRTLVRGRSRFDVVLLEVYSGMYFILASVVGLLCKFFDLPLIIVLHGGDLPKFNKKYPRWTRNVFDLADRLVAPSAFLAKEIGESGCEIQVIRNVIDITRYKFQERVGISPNLIWMRSFHPIYNPEMAVRAFARIRGNHRRATLTMAGIDKGIESRVRALVEKEGLSESVRFAGFLDPERKQKEFSLADIFINTNRIDNMPVSVVEAFAWGLPVVSTDVGGLPYLIVDGETGFLVSNEDDRAMARKIEALLVDPDLARRLSHNGRREAEKSGWKIVRGDWERLLTLAIGQRSVESHGSSEPDEKPDTMKIEETP